MMEHENPNEAVLGRSAMAKSGDWILPRLRDVFDLY
jgi:hypothetical protein